MALLAILFLRTGTRKEKRNTFFSVEVLLKKEIQLHLFSYDPKRLGILKRKS